MIGVSTGGRISELLSLTIGDVYQNGKVVSDLLYNRSIVKGGEVSRAVPVNIDGRDAIEALIDWHREKYATVDGVLWEGSTFAVENFGCGDGNDDSGAARRCFKCVVCEAR